MAPPVLLDVTMAYEDFVPGELPNEKKASRLRDSGTLICSSVLWVVSFKGWSLVFSPRKVICTQKHLEAGLGVGPTFCDTARNLLLQEVEDQFLHSKHAANARMSKPIGCFGLRPVAETKVVCS